MGAQAEGADWLQASLYLAFACSARKLIQVRGADGEEKKLFYLRLFMIAFMNESLIDGRSFRLSSVIDDFNPDGHGTEAVFLSPENAFTTLVGLSICSTKFVRFGVIMVRHILVGYSKD